MSANTTERVRDFLRYFYCDYGWFESITGIKSSKWRDLERGKTKAVTVEMIDELCRFWPEFAYWFVTGNGTSVRGQTTPADYFDLTYGTVRAHEPDGYTLRRDANGVLSPELGNMGVDPASERYEKSVAQRILYFSASTNERDAESLTNEFWTQFVKPIKKGKEIYLSAKDIKEWVNQFPVNCSWSPEEGNA